MRILASLLLVVSCTPSFAVGVSDDAYGCRDRKVAERIAGDRELASLGAKELFERVSAAGEASDRRIATLDRDIAKIRERLEADREAVKTGKALEFQTGVRKNWRPTEQVLHEGETKLVGMVGDRDEAANEKKRWAAISAACAVPENKSNVRVVQVLAAKKLALVRVPSGSAETRLWVPTRFLMNSARGKK